jgi:Tfp pilus assembly protein PilV
MSRLPCDNRGFTLVEVVIAMFLTIVAVLGILALVSPAWRTAARSDYLGRASGILYKTLMTQEALIMNPCCIVTAGVTGPTVVFASGEATAQRGDVQFNVTTTITGIPPLNPTAWRVTVQVSWPPLNATGITESLIVKFPGEEAFRAECDLGTSRGITCP